MHMRFLLPFVASLALTGCGSIPSLPDLMPGPNTAKITPKTGKPILTLDAKGVQIFRCTRDSRGAYWRFERPQASLFDASGEKTGELSGPMQAFSLEDGSEILSTRTSAWIDAPSGAKDLKWILYKATPSEKKGQLNGVYAVQRINTKGGVPNPGTCPADDQGKLLKVPFSAEFVFWR